MQRTAPLSVGAPFQQRPRSSGSTDFHFRFRLRLQFDPLFRPSLFACFFNLAWHYEDGVNFTANVKQLFRRSRSLQYKWLHAPQIGREGVLWRPSDQALMCFLVAESQTWQNNRSFNSFPITLPIYACLFHDRPRFSITVVVLCSASICCISNCFAVPLVLPRRAPGRRKDVSSAHTRVREPFSFQRLRQCQAIQAS